MPGRSKVIILARKDISMHDDTVETSEQKTEPLAESRR